MKKTARGFTLVELLVVIAIIAILAAVVVLIINPLELTRRSRDAARLTDLANLQQAINVAVQEATASGGQILCGTSGSNYTCVGHSDDTDANVRNSNGSGWVKVNLSLQKSVSIPTLPADPTNSTDYHYTYCASDTVGSTDSWEIDTALESDQQKGKMATDGGDQDTLYEVGSNLNLITAAGTPCAY
ncbi:prepilin-type N-terminal cleavage/methylation domain-containing protein [Patescibacteria group bacterium]|nr:prepilin-type N-terminal cleavage/methylation domain-containing protein [Patescibacteria group bacterium]MCL5409929.1 prepilin-type N-terminal cleavage/methylation domain-containing protein [Patescibacteria group bacterium]